MIKSLEHARANLSHIAWRLMPPHLGLVVNVYQSELTNLSACSDAMPTLHVLCIVAYDL